MVITHVYRFLDLTVAVLQPVLMMILLVITMRMFQPSKSIFIIDYAS